MYIFGECLEQDLGVWHIWNAAVKHKEWWKSKGKSVRLELGALQSLQCLTGGRQQIQTRACALDIVHTLQTEGAPAPQIPTATGEGKRSLCSSNFSISHGRDVPAPLCYHHLDTISLPKVFQEILRTG